MWLIAGKNLHGMHDSNTPAHPLKLEEAYGAGTSLRIGLVVVFGGDAYYSTTGPYCAEVWVFLDQPCFRYNEMKWAAAVAGDTQRDRNSSFMCNVWLCEERESKHLPPSIRLAIKQIRAELGTR